MWLVDNSFLTAIADGSEPHIKTISVDLARPYFDVEIISAVHLAAAEPDPEIGYPAEELLRLQEEFINRFRQLRRQLNTERSHLLVNCGDLTVGRPAAATAVGRNPRSTYLNLYRDLWIPAFERLTSEIAPSLLTVPGHQDVARRVTNRTDATPNEPSAWHADHYYRHFLGHFLGNAAMPDQPALHPAASVFRVMADPGDVSSAPPLAYVAIIGFDSNAAHYSNGFVQNHGQVSREQLDASVALVRTLTSTVAKNVPLYVIGVTHHTVVAAEGRTPNWSASTRKIIRGLDDDLECQVAGEEKRLSAFCGANHLIADSTVGMTLNASEFLKHCQRLRAAVVVHAHMQRRDITDLSSTPLVAGQSGSDLPLVACPAFEYTPGSSGMARLRIDLWEGQLEVAFIHDAESGVQGRPVQIARPVISASRVDASERRLYTKVHQLLDGATAGERAEQFRVRHRRIPAIYHTDLRGQRVRAALAWG